MRSFHYAELFHNTEHKKILAERLETVFQPVLSNGEGTSLGRRQ